MKMSKPKSSKTKFNKRALFKQLIFSIIPVLLLFVCAEIVIRVVYYQRKENSPLALGLLVEKFQRRRTVNAAEQKINTALRDLGVTENVEDIRRAIVGVEGVIRRELFSENGQDVLEHLENIYEQSFNRLVDDVNSIGAKLLVLHIPSSSPDSPSGEAFQHFIETLVQNYQTDYLDLSPLFFQYPKHWPRLYPEDAHLSRFGNKLVEKALSLYIEKHSSYRITHSFQKRPALLGGLQPSTNAIWEMRNDMPFRIVTNAQGLRMSYDLTFPKTMQRILILGDSYTFGPYLDNHDTYPELLDRKYPEKEIINGGVCGYTITDQRALFKERSQYIEPDIVILQVYKNDILDLFFFRRTFNTGFHSGTIKPSEVEIIFLKKIGLML